MGLRPFYFVLVVWGREYRDYFLEYCLPSLLSPGNIPALDGRRPAKFLIATTAKDWSAMCDTAIVRELAKHAEPVFIELPPQGECPYWRHAIEGHKLCCDRVAREKAYRFFVGPDAIYSDGAVERVHEVALDGAEAVLTFVPLLTRADLFFKTLGEMKLRPEKSARDTGAPIVISPRQAVALAITALHGLSKVNEWDSPEFCGYASTPWWRDRESDGLVTCGLRWDLMLCDYTVAHHDGSLLDTRGFDGDYIMRAIGHLETIYLLRDSDDLHVVTWVSLPEPAQRRKPLAAFEKGVKFRASAHGPSANELQRTLLCLPNFLHAGRLGKQSAAVEETALRTMLTWVDPPRGVERYSRRLPEKRRNFAGFDARIAACRLPWWRRNPILWGMLRGFVIPLVTQVPQSILPQARRILLWPRRMAGRLIAAR